MANVIDSLNLNNVKYSFTLPYGSCSTAADTAAKAVTVSNFNLDIGSRILVKFTSTNNAAAPTLDVNGTGAKPIYYRGSAIKEQALAADRTYEFVYNGAQWELIGDLDNNALASTSAAGLMSAADKSKLDGMVTGAGKEAYLQWGGRNIVGDISPVDAAMSEIHSANRFAFAKPEGITIEYSQDGGASWLEYPTSPLDKQSLVSGIGTRYFVGNRTSGVTTNDRLRITLNATAMWVYTNLKKLLINIGQIDAGNSFVLIEKAMQGSETTFIKVGVYELVGQSGWNSIPISTYFGGDTSQTGNTAILRLTFNASATLSAMAVHDILAFGTTYWRYPSEMARTGHLYSYNSQKQAYFPSDVIAPLFNGPATKLSTSAGNLTTPVYFKDGQPTECELTADSVGAISKAALDDAGIKSVTYENVYNFAVTTAKTDSYISPHARPADITGRLSKHYTYKVTYDGVVYELPCEIYCYTQEGTIVNGVEYIGNLSLYTENPSVTHRIRTELPFCVIFDLDSPDDPADDSILQIDVFTQEAGNHTFIIDKKVIEYESIPTDLIYGTSYYPFEFKNNPGVYNGTSIGVNSLSNSRGTIAIGYGNECSADFAVAIGNGNVASGNNSHAEGSGTTASGTCTNSKGYKTTASGDYASAEGNQATASGHSSHAEGYQTNASKDIAHAEGYKTIASGDVTHAEGRCTTASGLYAHAEGNYTTASGAAAHAEGDSTTASGLGTHAEGGMTVASNQGAHAEGMLTEASGLMSHAEGQLTVASGGTDHVEGSRNISKAAFAHIEGEGNILGDNGVLAHIQGVNNLDDNTKSEKTVNVSWTDDNGQTTVKERALGKYAHVVGNGISNENRSNAHTLDWDGNAWYQGNGTFQGGNITLGNTTINENQLKSFWGFCNEIKGTWKFNDELTIPADWNDMHDVFTYKTEKYFGNHSLLSFYNDGTAMTLWLDNSILVYDSTKGGWLDSSAQTIIVISDYDEILSNHTKIEFFKWLNENAVKQLDNDDNSVLIQLTSIDRAFHSDGWPIFHIRIRVVSGNLQVGDQIRIYKTVSKYKHNRDKTTGKKRNVRQVEKLQPIGNQTWIGITAEDIAKAKISKIYSLTVEDGEDIWRSYSSSIGGAVGWSIQKRPLTLYVVRPMQISNNRELSYIPISNGIKLGTNTNSLALKSL